jgi:hypothetical protein
MTIEITRPETEALIELHLRSGRFQNVDELLATALGALHEPTPASVAGAKNLAELLEPVRGLFADGELDFSRSHDVGRPVDL